MKYCVVLNVIFVVALCLRGTFLDAAQQKMREEKLQMQNVDALNQELLQAAEESNIDEIKAIYRAHMVPDILVAKNALDQNALMIAARNLSIDVVNFLKTALVASAKKSLAEQRDINGYTALMMAIEVDVAEKKGLDFRKKRQLKIIGNLLDSFESDINARTEAGSTPLMLAVARDNEAVVKELLAHRSVGDSPKVDVNAQDKNGISALIIAVNNGNENIVRKLLQAGAKIDLKDNAGKTAKDYAYHKPLILLPIVIQEVALLQAPMYMWTREGRENINVPVSSGRIARSITEADFPALPESVEQTRSQSANEGDSQIVRLHVHSS